MEEEELNIEIENSNVTEILERVPPWILRWGTTVVFVLLFFTVIITWFIKYPDTIEGEISITTINPPYHVIAKTSGEIEELFFEDHKNVNKGSLIGVLNNPTSYNDYKLLIKYIDTLDTYSFDSYKKEFPTNLVLGNLQDDYISMISFLSDVSNFYKLNPIISEIEILKKKVKNYGALISSKSNKVNIIEKELILRENEYNRLKSLYEKGGLSKQELETKELELTFSKRIYEDLIGDLELTKITVADVEQNIIKLSLEDQNKKLEFTAKFKTNLSVLKSSVLGWEELNLLKTSIGGKLSYSKFWAENQFVIKNDIVCSVVPDENQELIGKLIIPARNSGKIKEGQEVLIYLDNYDYKEYGIVRGTVNTVSLFPVDGGYSVEVLLPEGLATKFKKQIPLTQGGEGKAQIITEDVRLLERFFYSIRSVFD